MLRQKRTIALAVAALGTLTASAANRRLPYDALAAESDKVVLGSVGSRSSHWGDDAHIYTDVLVYPDVMIKGADEGPVLVRVLGGTVGDTTMTVSDGPDLPEGQRVVVFLKQEDGGYVVSGRSAGAIDAAAPEAVAAIDSAFSSAEKRTGRRMSSARGLAQSYLGRGTARTTGRATSRAQVGCYSTDGSKWNAAYATYRIGSSVPAEWAPAIDASTATWNAVSAGFRLVNDSSSVNELSYKDLVAAYGSSYSNTYAVTTTWMSSSTRAIVKATIEINTKWPWSTTGATSGPDVQNVLTHEFGHWMRLLDIYSPSTCNAVTMWGSAAYGETSKRTLEQADIDGFRSLYGGSGASGGSGGTTASVTAPVLASPSNGATGVATTVALTWNAAANATSYDVYLGPSTAPGLVANVTGTSYQPGNLIPGVTYSWRVVAKNSTGSAASSTYSFTVSAGTPAPAGPTLLSPANGASGVGLTNTYMQWTAVSGATQYDVYIGTTPSPGYVGSVSGTGAYVSGFQSGTVYYWKVVARTAGGSASSAVWSFQTN